MQTVAEYLADERHIHTRREYLGREYLLRFPVLCANGLSLSIQSSGAHYCTVGASVEIGFPNRAVKALEGYREKLPRTGPKQSIYPHVPLEVAEEIIAKAGGIVAEVRYL